MDQKRIANMTLEDYSPEEIAEQMEVTIEALKLFCKMKNIILNPSRYSHKDYSKPEEEKPLKDLLPKPERKKSPGRPKTVEEKQKTTIRKFDATVEEIEDMYLRQNMTRKEIAFEKGVSYKTVDAFMGLHGIKRSSTKGRKFYGGNIRSKEDFIEKFEFYQNAKDMANFYDVSLSTIYLYAKDAELVFPRHDLGKKYESMKEEYVKTSDSLSAFCRMNDLDYNAFYLYLRRNGVKPRTKKEAEYNVPLGVVEMKLCGIMDLWYDLEGYEGKFKINEDGIVVRYGNVRVDLVPMTRIEEDGVKDYIVHLKYRDKKKRSDLLKQFEEKEVTS